MILNDFTVPKTKYSNEQLDAVLVELCEIILEGKQDNPDFYGSVSAAVIDPKGRLVTGLNYVYGNYRIHAERAAIDKYEAEYGELPKGSIVVTTLSPCSDRMDSRYEESCADLLNSKGVKLAYCGYNDPTQENTQDKFVTIITENSKLKALCKKFADTFLKKHIDENFTKIKKTSYNIQKIEEQFGPINYKDNNRHFGLAQLQIKNKSLFEHCMSIGYDRGFNIFCDIIDSKEYADCDKPLLTENIDQTDQNLIKIFDRFNSFNTNNFRISDSVYYIELTAVEGIATNSKNIYMDHTSKALEIVGINQNYITFANGQTYPDKFIQQTKKWSQLVMFASETKMNSCLSTLLMYQNKLGAWTLNSPEKLDENFADGKGPGRPGDSQRHGISKGASMAELEKASHSKGRKGQLARWQLNMRRGHKK